MGKQGMRVVVLAMVAAAVGGCGLFKSPNAVEAVDAFARAANRLPLIPSSNIVRNSGAATYVRLSRLFGPYANAPTYEQLYFGPETAGTYRPLGAKDRPTHALAQYALRVWTLTICAQLYSSSMFTAGAEILMEGESLPSDPVTRLAFAAARNGWLFPYAADSGEVKLLADLYRETAANPDGTIDATQDGAARREVCVAVLTAPQFWIGNQHPADVIRRVALELGRRVPTFQEFSDYLKGRMTLDAYVRRIQGEEGYLKAVGQWHKHWLRFFPPGPMKSFDMRPGDLWQGNFHGATSGYAFRVPAGSPLAGESYAKVYGGYAFNAFASDRCEMVDEAFDPRTVEVRWEHKNPLLSSLPEAEQWETVASWRRARDGSGNYTAQWEQVSGQVTTAIDGGGDRTYRTTRLTDITYSSSDNANVAWEPFRYRRGNLVGTPMEVFMGTERRVRRFAVTGEQKGMSVIRAPITGQPVRICNALDRYTATCAYRPNKRVYDDTWLSFYALQDWDATVPKVSNDVRYLRDTYFHPEVLDSFKCGPPNMSAMTSLGTPAQYPRPWDDPQENVAWPPGYEGYAQPLSQLALNDVGHYLSTTAWDYLTYLDPSVGKADMSFGDVVAVNTLQNDMNQEPYRLIDDIIRNGRDYRLMLTAKHTFGTEYYEYMLRTQGYFLPGNPPGWQPSWNAEQANAVRKIDFTQFQPIPIKALESVMVFSGSQVNGTGTHSMADAVSMKDLIEQGEIRPRVASGILTMPAFTSGPMPAYDQYAFYMRTISARYFTRLMCGAPNMITLTDAQKDLHERYIPQVEAAAKDHLDRTKGCYTCHVNMDPLAAALSSNFMSNVYSYSTLGELRIFGPGPYYQGTWYGIRGGGPPSKGAFLGQEVNGVVDVGRILADSAEFNRCAVQIAFQNVYGRDVGMADVPVVTRITKDFMRHHNYNTMVRDLATATEFERGN
jgi:hypothetical protein